MHQSTLIRIPPYPKLKGRLLQPPASDGSCTVSWLDLTEPKGLPVEDIMTNSPDESPAVGLGTPTRVQ